MTAVSSGERDLWGIRANARSLMLGNVAYALGTWLQLAIVARVGGVRAVGEYAFALALTAPVMMLASLQLRSLLSTDVPGVYAFAEYRRLRTLTTGAAFLAVLFITWAIGAGALWHVIVPVCALRAADALSDVYYGLWQREERMAVVGWSLLFNAAASVAFMAGAALLDLGVGGAATGSALGSAATAAFVHLRTAKDRELRRALPSPGAPTTWQRLGRLAADAWPLGLVVLLGSLRENVPRFFLQRLAGADALGLFAAAAQLTTAGNVVVGALGSATSPRLALLSSSADPRRFRGLTRKLALVGLLLGGTGVALSAGVGREVLGLLYGSEFGRAAPMLVVLSVAAALAFAATLIGYALTAARVIAVQPFLIAGSLAVLALSCAVLVPRHGGPGAAWAVVAGAATFALGSAIVLQRYHSRPTARLDADPFPRPPRSGLARLAAPGTTRPVSAPAVEPLVPASRNTEPRLLFVTTVPGTLAFLFPFAEHFRRLGWTVDALTGSSGAVERREHFDRVFDIRWSRHPLDLENLLRAPSRVRGVIAAQRYDIVHVHTPVASFVTRFALRDHEASERPSVVYTAHGFHFHPGGSAATNAAFLALEKLAGRWTDYLVVINREDELAAVQHRIVPADRVRPMPGIGVDLSLYAPERVDPAEVRSFRRLQGLGDDPCVLVLAELIPRKRHHDVLKAFSSLVARGGGVCPRLLLAGKGPLAEKLRREAHRLGVDGRVHFLGSRRDVPILMRASQVLVLASSQEGLPRSILEAMSMGLPVIGTRIRGTSELLADGAGFLYDVGDVTALGDLLWRSLVEPGTALTAAKLARQRVSRYCLEHVLALHERLYAEALAARRPGAPARSTAAQSHMA